jgi:phosphomevalonate kinase
MTAVLRSSAPGKVILSGEYAVLDGAPAICMAVDRRARATLTESKGDNFEVTSPGYSEGGERFRVSNGKIDWLGSDRPIEVVESVWRAVDSETATAQAIDLNTTDFMDSESGKKIGIGSSAAITVAFCAALKNTADAAAIGSAALRAHAELQGGAGSGTDIACSLHGGLIEYRMEGSSVTNLEWPSGLYYRIVWAGSCASTTDKLAILDAVISKPSRVRLAGASETLAAAWRNGRAAEILAEYEGYCETLYEFSVDHDLGIFDAGHKELRQTAASLDLIYKPCGAGGGDIGIALGGDEAVLERFAGMLTSNQTILDARLDETGVQVEVSPT